MPLSERTQAFLDQFSAQMTENPGSPISEMTINDYRTAANSFRAFALDPHQDVRITEQFADTQEGNIRFQKLVPVGFSSAESLPTVIFFPGGGFISELEIAHCHLSHVAAQASCQILIPFCAIAPEQPFPAGINQAKAFFDFCSMHKSELQIDGSNLFLAGDSSGGNFATLVALHAMRQGLPIRRQILISPVVDLSANIKASLAAIDLNVSGIEEQIEKSSKDLLLQPELVRWVYALYCDRSQALSPEVSPLFQPSSILSSSPPTTIMVAEYDALSPEALAYTTLLRREGVEVNLDVFSGQVHSFFIARNILSDGRNPHQAMAEHIKSTLAAQLR